MLIGIAGDSGVGKTTFAKIIYEIYYPSAKILHLDDYHKYSRKERKLLKITPLNPRCNDLKLLEKHLELIKKGKEFIKNVYDHKTGKILKNYEIYKPAKINIIEGLFPFLNEKLAKYYDIKIFLDITEGIKLYWKIMRDLEKRGYVIFEDLKERIEDYKKYIYPQVKYADIIIKLNGFIENKYRVEILFQRDDIFLKKLKLYSFFKDLDVSLKNGKIILFGNIKKEELLTYIKLNYTDNIYNRLKIIINKYNTYTLSMLLTVDIINNLLRKQP